ncbi:MAG TPA: hypothetical protein VGF85_03645 [Opitutaceae bacterium]|jgi:hypothetical protein
MGRFIRTLPLTAWVAAAALACGAVSGCASAKKWSEPKTPVPPVHRNYVGEARLPTTLRRVLLMPVWGGEAAPAESAAALDSVFATALVHQKRFEVVTISREECRRRFGEDSFSSASALPADFLGEIGRDFAAQGVIFVDLTAYHPIRPILLGVRSKLALVDGGRLIWSFDDEYSAEDPAVIQGLKKFYAASGGDRGETPANLPEAALISPSRFGAFAAEATFQTLPPR